LHPPLLSEQAASLLPDRDRRAFVWRFVLDDGARPVETTLTRAVVRSRRQWSYPEAQRAIDAGDAPDSLRALPWFGAQRAERERERGGASLNTPDVEIVQDGERYHLVRRASLPVEDHNAHVSLLTGMAAADIMLRGGIGILRTMPPPDDEDMAAFRARAAALGLPWPEDESYGEYLRRLDPADPRAPAVQDAAASLFRGAGYVAFRGSPPEQPAQAAVGAPYAHTTAPIRRLVDRWSLVICDALAAGREVPSWAAESVDELTGMMARSSGLAGRYNAASIDRIEAALLRPLVGRELPAIVVRTGAPTARVLIDDPIVEASCP